MSKNSIKNLFERYLSGTATVEEQRLVEDWYEQFELNSKTPSDSEIDKIADSVWKRINQIEEDETNVYPLATWKGVFRWAVAALVVFALGFGLIKYFSKNNISEIQLSENQQENKQSGNVTEINDSNENKKIVLEDNSTVLLFPKSQLEYPIHFEKNQRQVFLKGKAFFNISENPNRPFLVQTGNITTKVLGTSFTIKADPEDENIEVAVRTGKVSVYESKEITNLNPAKNKNGVILLPNQQVNYSKLNNVFITKLVENPVVIDANSTIVRKNFKYDDTPLSTVLADLTETYGIEFEVERMNMKTCPLTATLSDKSLYDNLDVICAAIGATYEVQGTRILISGNGCD
jgi:transmembrane sensor